MAAGTYLNLPYIKTCLCSESEQEAQVAQKAKYQDEYCACAPRDEHRPLPVSPLESRLTSGPGERDDPKKQDKHVDL